MSRSIGLDERLAGAVRGHLVGDAVGVPYEFKPGRPAAQVVFGAKGTHDQPPGTWSDDGALMLALLDSLLTHGFDTTHQPMIERPDQEGSAVDRRTQSSSGLGDPSGRNRGAVLVRMGLAVVVPSPACEARTGRD